MVEPARGQCCGLLAALVCLVHSTSAPAQWSAIRLHNPTDFRESRVLAISASQQFGFVLSNVAPLNFQPVAWAGSSANWGSLSTSPVVSGRILGGGGGQQVGDSSATGGASLWSGTPESLVSLRPFDAWDSHGLGADGQQQVGYYVQTPGGQDRAVLWHGTAASAVSLHPTGATSSMATSTADGLVGGWVEFPTAIQAALWAGSAQSVTYLHPGPLYAESHITAMAPGQQAGWVRRFDQNSHAALWSGTAASFLDLNPPSAAASFLYGTCGNAQVGNANLPGLGNTAGVWFGTADSFVPLAPFLPPGYFQSTATCIAESNGTFYVGGYATSIATGQDEAFMWVGVPGPGPMTILLLAAPLATRRRR